MALTRPLKMLFGHAWREGLLATDGRSCLAMGRPGPLTVCLGQSNSRAMCGRKLRVERPER